MPSLAGINFLFNQLEPKSRWDRIYDWVVNTAKYIVICVELLIIIGFVIRFVLDDQNSQLEDDIKTEQLLLDNRKDQERQISNLVFALTEINQVYKTDPFLDGYNTVMGLIPSGIKINSISVGISSSSLQGEAPGLDQVKAIESNLKGSADITVQQFSINQKQSGVAFEAQFVVNKLTQRSK